jgi:tetratricopeptide (TPR) repeat protein
VSDILDPASAERAQALAVAGRWTEAAALFQQAADALEAQGRGAEAFEPLVTAARLQASAGDRALATALLKRATRWAHSLARRSAVATALGEMADQSGEPGARTAAWTAATNVGDDALTVMARFRLSQVAKAANDPAGMNEHLTAALAVAERRDAPAQLAEVLLERTVALIALGQHDSAGADLARAARVTPSDERGLQARIRGQRGVLAAAQDRVQDALDDALAARALAVEASDAGAYLAASQLAVLCYEATGQPVLAYDTVLRAKTSLGDLLGEGGQQLVEPALQAFMQRHAADLDAIHAEWVALRARSRATGQG